jgi:hypothetical protein
MFEKIVLRRSQSGSVLTLGEIAEAMLFYQNVHIIIDYGALHALIDTIGMRGLLGLLARKNITATYTEEMFATNTQTIGNRHLHNFTAFTVSGDRETGHIKSKQKRLEYLLHKKGHSWKEARTFAERFRKRVPTQTFGGNYFVTGGIPKAVAADISQFGYFEAAMRQICRHTAGLESYADTGKFEVVPQQGGFEIWTNIDFDAVNARRKMLDLGPEQITEARLACNFLDASSDIVLAAHYGGEFYTSAISSDVVRLRYAQLLRRVGISATELSELRDVVLPEYPTIRETINGRARTFDEFLTLLDKSQKFREWIQGLNPDAKVAHEYVQSITAEGWMASVPAKLVRYALASDIGLVGPTSGLIAGAADSFLLDRISRGWRPSHFIDGKLKPFLGEQQ